MFDDGIQYNKKVLYLKYKENLVQFKRYDDSNKTTSDLANLKLIHCVLTNSHEFMVIGKI